MNILIILGFKLQPNNRLTPTLMERLKKAHQLFSTGKYDKIIVSGGKVQTNSTRTEAYMMKRYLTLWYGIKESYILTESKSKDTIENAQYCLTMLNKIKNIKSITVLSSKFHIKRVKYIFNYYLQPYKKILSYTRSNNKMSLQERIMRTKNEKKYIQRFKKKIVNDHE